MLIDKLFTPKGGNTSLPEKDEDDNVVYLAPLSYEGEAMSKKILQRKREEELRKKYGIKFLEV